MMEMSAEDFLKTGMLELFVIGELDHIDQALVQTYIDTYPEVKSKYDEIQNAVMDMADNHAIPPPMGTKSQILRKIDCSDYEAKRATNWYKYATIAASLVAGLLAVTYLMNISNLKSELAAEKSRLISCQEESEQILTQNKAYVADLAFYTHHATRSIPLSGNKTVPGFEAVAFYNKMSEQMTIQVLDEKAPPVQKCYYLWGDLSGKMIKIGKLNEVEADDLMAFDSDMDSFNITLEDATTNIDHPDVSQLVASVQI